jgi:hypothetical protein
VTESSVAYLHIYIYIITQICIRQDIDYQVVSNLVCNKAEFNNIIRDMVRALVFNVTFNNILVISWWSVLLVEETGVPEENHRPAASH